MVVVEVDSTDECDIFCVVVCSLGNIFFPSIFFFQKQKQKAFLKQNTHKIEGKNDEVYYFWLQPCVKNKNIIEKRMVTQLKYIVTLCGYSQ